MALTAEDMASRLGRLERVDPRDRQYLLRTITPEPDPDRRWRYWWTGGWWGDQDEEPQCVAYAWLHWAKDGPVTHPFRKRHRLIEPKELYDRAQRKDGIPGTDYEGTTVRAGAKVLQTEGLVDTYRWAWDLDTAVRAVLTTGPVVVGSWWWTKMFWPEPDGMIRAQGRREGGHAYVLNGVNLHTGLARIKNSWGRDWGRRGHAYLTLDDLDRLISEHGEVCMAEAIRRAA